MIRIVELMAGLPDGLKPFVGKRGIRFPDSQRQRIGIARALYHDPAMLVPDAAASAFNSNA